MALRLLLEKRGGSETEGERSSIFIESETAVQKAEHLHGWARTKKM